MTQNNQSPAVISGNLQTDKKFVGKFNKSKTLPEMKSGAELQYFDQLMRKNPKLQNCEPSSIRTALLDVAFSGLSLAPSKAHAYLIPYGKECQFMPGYRGILHLVYKAGTVKLVQPVLHYEKEELSIDTINNKMVINHKRIMGRPAGKIVGVYTIAYLTSGVEHVEYMNELQIAACEKAATSRANGGMVWRSAFKDQMIIKSCIRRASKYWPDDNEGLMEHAREVMRQYDPGEPDFGTSDEPEAAGEPVVLVDDNQLLEIHAALTQGLDGIEGLESAEASDWMKKKAQAMGYNVVEHLPADKADQCKAELLDRLRKVRAAK